MDGDARGFILRRRKRENHIGAGNTTSKNIEDRLDVYDVDTLFFFFFFFFFFTAYLVRALCVLQRLFMN